MSEIATFCAVVATKSFSEAAKRLGISRALVSKRINGLEERLGTRLIHRSTRGFALTEAGEIFYRRGLEVTQRIEHAEREVRELASSHAGRIRVAASLVCGCYGTPLTKELLDQYPDLEFQLDIVDGPIDIINGGYDAIIHVGERRDSSLICRKVAEGRFCVVATPDYLQEHGTPATPQELGRFNCLTQDLYSETKWIFQKAGAEPFAIAVSGNFSASNDFALHKASLLGMGLCQLPSLLVCEDILAGHLVPVLEEFAHYTLDVFVIYPSRDLTDKTRTLIEALIEFASARKSMLPPISAVS